MLLPGTESIPSIKRPSQASKIQSRALIDQGTTKGLLEADVSMSGM